MEEDFDSLNPGFWGPKLLKILGVPNPDEIYNFKLEIDHNEIPTITCKYMSRELLKKTHDYVKSSFEKQYYIKKNKDYKEP